MLRRSLYRTSLLVLVLCWTAILWMRPSSASAALGVGVGTPTISFHDPLKSGETYQLPPFVVINTGDQKATYRVNVMYHEGQPQKRPAASWFSFSPKSVEIEPGTSAEIALTLKIPYEAEVGDYFAYIEAMPHISIPKGHTKVGIAAAGKLTFSVEKGAPPMPGLEKLAYGLVGGGIILGLIGWHGLCWPRPKKRG